MEYFADLVPKMRSVPQPVIAAVNGPAIGGGMCLSLGADIRLAAESAYWRAAGINNGLGAVELGLSWTLWRVRSGRPVRSRSACPAVTSDAAEADRIGLVSRTVPDAELMDETLALADRICGYSTHGVSMTKTALWAGLETGSLDAAIDLENRNQLLVRLTTENLEEYIRARRDGRPPGVRRLIGRPESADPSQASRVGDGIGPGMDQPARSVIISLMIAMSK